MKAEQEVPAVVVSSILTRFRRFSRSSRPLCAGAFALSLLPGALASVEPVASPKVEVAEAQVPMPEKPPAAPAQAAAPETPPAETPTPPAETPKTAPAETPEPAKDPNPQPPAADSAPHASPKQPTRRHPSLDFDESLGKPKAPFAEQIYEVAVRHAINPHLVAALIHVESAFNPRAVSRKGACGLMQLLPATARRFGLKKKKEIFDPAKNLDAGVRYLKWLTRRFNGDVHRVLAAYNAGEGAVDRFGGIPPYRETQQYVRKIFGILGFTSDSKSEAEPAGGGESSGDAEVVPAGR